MKLMELIYLNKIIEERRNTAEKLQSRVEYFEALQKINLNKDKSLIDIRNMYTVLKNDISYFTLKKDNNYIDFFSKDIINVTDSCVITPIRESFSILNIYPDELVPYMLLEYLYYRANNISISMINLKRKNDNDSLLRLALKSQQK